MQPCRRSRISLATLLLIFFAVAPLASQAQQLGGPLPGLKPTETKFFNNGQSQFNRLWGLTEGVGPVITDGACKRCHNTPVLGGGGIRLLTFFGKTSGGTFDPLFNEGGLLLQPISNAAFIPGGVCTLPGEQIPLDANSVERRIAPPVFGFGLIDAISDTDIINEAANELANDQVEGIHGTANIVTTYYQNPEHTVGRFGKKSQIANLIEMAAFAFAHDIGITNPIFQDEDLPQGGAIPPECVENSLTPNNNNSGSGGIGMFPLSHFPRYLAPPIPAAPTPQILAGQVVFDAIGCSKCHKPSYQTPSNVSVRTDLAGTMIASPALSNQTVGLYSDLLLHDMGISLIGKIPPGYQMTQNATLTQWRTVPLWGLSVRARYLHDGRASDLNSAILGHSLDGKGEAAVVVGRYKTLTPTDQSNLMAFLHSL
jgi:di-heme oxidoreductase (putative peroxidase)